MPTDTQGYNSSTALCFPRSLQQQIFGRGTHKSWTLTFDRRHLYTMSEQQSGTSSQEDVNSLRQFAKLGRKDSLDLELLVKTHGATLHIR